MNHVIPSTFSSVLGIIYYSAWIYLVLKSISPNKRASHQKTSIIYEVTPGVCVQNLV